MRRLWNEFKGFAMSGNMIDLALGFIIGAAFAKIVTSLASNVLMQFVAVIVGRPDFTQLVLTVHGGEIRYGAFLTDLVDFVLLAGLLFLVVKLIVFLGVGQNRSFGTQQCPWCTEHVAPTALVCRYCRLPLVDDLPSLDDARVRLDDLTRRKGSLLAVVPRRRRGSGTDAEATGDDLIDDLDDGARGADDVVR